MEKALVMVLPFLERAKMGEFDKWKKENRKEGIQSDYPQVNHLFLQPKGVMSNDVLSVS